MLIGGSIPSSPTKIMNRRDFLMKLGVAAVIAPVLANKPIEEPAYNRITMKPEVYSAWEEKMANDLVLGVRKRMNELVAEMVLKG